MILLDLQSIFQAFDIECEQEGDTVVLHCSLPIYRPACRVNLPLTINVIPEGQSSYSVRYSVNQVKCIHAKIL